MLSVVSSLILVGALYFLLDERISVPGSTPNCAQSERAERLVQAAEVHIMVGRLYEPRGSNACEAYADALKVCPDAPKALEGLRQIEEIGGKSCTP